jgi:transposase InsO family protein
MPWKETCVMDEKLRFVAAVHEKKETIAELCRRFGISRKTGYKLLERYSTQGPAALMDRSRARITHANAVPEAMVRVILAKREAHPTWGPRKLRVVLRKESPDTFWPASSTIGTLIKQAGLVEARRRRRRVPSFDGIFAPAVEPNERWNVDFKGWFRTRDGARCDPLTVTDDYSRYLLVCKAVEKANFEQVQACFEKAFEAYGLPARIRSDNGPPFATRALSGLSRLSVWWLKLGILPERIAPGHPEQNGRHERMHRTLKQETARPPKLNRALQQHAFDSFIEIYNNERPHEALHDDVPAAHYVAKPRGPMLTPATSYPEDTETRKVQGNGTILVRGEKVFLTRALAGETVLLEPVDDERRFFDVYYLDFHIGTIDSLYGTVKDVTLFARGNVTDETGPHGDSGTIAEFARNSTKGNALNLSPMCPV